MSKGVIFAIEEFAVHDGPGIRKAVFFKGCPLRCNWCHNPEGLSSGKQVLINRSLCVRCGKCYEVHAKGAENAVGSCVDVCPLRLGRICGTEYDAKTLADELRRGGDILLSSGGGITVSGGEPLAQPEFLLELLDELKPLNTAIETSGYAPEDVFRQAVDRADIVMMDVKHTDSDVHKRFTGVENAQILRNLRYLCESGRTFYIRIPLIPGVNDSYDNMQKTAELLRDAKSLVRVEILPYHLTAGAKYQMADMEYKPIFNPERIPEIHLEPFTANNIRSVVL